jgi:hypothetical protein
MNFVRSELFRFPWSQTDNPGAWIEVTDVCNFACPGCFRKNNITGHRPFTDIKKEIDFCSIKLNCSRICISGGEPLLYPDILEVVRYIRSKKMKAIILTNGENLTPDFLIKLKRAGLYQFYLHVDSGQNRPGWENKSEAEMNELRQYYADLIHKTGKIKCGYNLTIRRSNLQEIQDIVSWYRRNISRVNHLSLITYRGIPKLDGYDLYTFSGKVNKELVADNMARVEEIDISAIDIHNNLCNFFSDLYPAAYLNGTTVLDTYKYLIILNIGNDDMMFGEIGSKTVEIYQLLYHLIKGKYDAIIPDPGKWIFFLIFFDKRLRKAFYRYLKYILRNPVRLFYKTYVQALILQQPFEIINGQVNLCEGCINLMPYEGKLINSCRLDEYRILGGPITVLKQNTI